MRGDLAPSVLKHREWGIPMTYWPFFFALAIPSGRRRYENFRRAARLTKHRRAVREIFFRK
jgi:hypothetical protein